MLTDTDRAMLDLEAQRFKCAGAKDALVRERFGVSPTRYYARLAALIRTQEALAYAPSTVKRLLRLEERRRDARTG